MPLPPDPTYEYEVSRLVAYYKRAIADILRELERLDLSDMSRANAQAALASIAKILKELDADAAAWVEEYVPKAALDGVARAILAIGVVDTLAEAQSIAKFNRLNQNLVAAVVADTQADLLAVTKNVSGKVRAAVQSAVAESLRANLTKGINGRRTLNRDILTGMKRSLGDSVNTGIVDAVGRRWKPEVYVDMVSRTKMMYAHTEATINEALGRGVLYGQISRHGATDACRNYEGKIVKLTPDAPGPYPYIGDLRGGRDIFHPNCRHLVNPIRRPEGSE
jgi:hypothetical protein